jgi:hypothetical protein
VSTTTLKHNKWYNNLSLMTLYDGDSGENKSGEGVFLKSSTVKMHFNTFADRPQVMFRIMLRRIRRPCPRKSLFFTRTQREGTDRARRRTTRALLRDLSPVGCGAKKRHCKTQW